MYSPCSSRRSFVKACAALAALSAASSSRLAPPAFALEDAPKVKLADKNGEPIKASKLVPHENYMFLYPYISTPCLLLRLGTRTSRDVEHVGDDAAAYKWLGGAGKEGDVVAYSTICSHALTSDNKQASFLTYSKGKNRITGHERAITCCAHASVFDPALGAKVLAGPAPFPLAAVQLEYDAATDELTAVGFAGSELFDKFFGSQKEDLIAEFGRGGYKELVTGRAIVLPIKEFSKDIIQC